VGHAVPSHNLEPLLGCIYYLIRYADFVNVSWLLLLRSRHVSIANAKSHLLIGYLHHLLTDISSRDSVFSRALFAV